MHLRFYFSQMKAWDDIRTMSVNSSPFPALSHLTLVQRTLDADFELFPDQQNILNDHKPQNASNLDSILSYTTSRYIHPDCETTHFISFSSFLQDSQNFFAFLSIWIWRGNSKQNQLQYIQGNLSLQMMTCIWGTYCIHQAGTFPAFGPDSQFRHLKRLNEYFSIHTTATRGSASRKRKAYNVRQKRKEFRTLWIRRFWFLSV